jgi:hypothetical protein
MGQQKVNKATREHPIWSELIWLNQALRPGIPSGQESRASTLNPKVEGSNPSRPMAPETNRESERQTTQRVREITKADTA